MSAINDLAAERIDDEGAAADFVVQPVTSSSPERSVKWTAGRLRPRRNSQPLFRNCLGE